MAFLSVHQLKLIIKYPRNYLIFSCHTAAVSVYDKVQKMERIERIHRQIQGLEQDWRPKAGNRCHN
jgi:hypothetical protein